MKYILIFMLFSYAVLADKYKDLAPGSLEAAQLQKSFANDKLPIEKVLVKSGIVLRLIPPGEFKMGSPETEKGRYDNEGYKLIKIEKPFYIGKFEVTQEQWQKVMGKNPSLHNHPKKPLENVNLQEVKEFLKKLNELEKSIGELRLPSSEEFEYACRAGTKTAVYTGDVAEGATCPNLDKIAWYKSNSGKMTHPVGLKLPNAFGLFDMVGNVWEWTSSVGKHPNKESRPITRGGVFNRPNKYNRAAKVRTYFRFESRSNSLGLRIVMEINQ